jgi:nucleotide-binding universal stress UspA family protein
MKEKPVQVVVAYDFSPSAEAALARAVEVAARAPQHVLHVIAALEQHASFGTLHTVTYETAEQIQTTIGERIQQAFAGRPAEAEVQFFVHARIGKPAEEILELAREVGADMIFIGTHSKTGIERVLLGSVSERVVREARCPVMVVRAKTYADVDLVKVVHFEHRPNYTRPHRYSYVETRLIARPPEWPLN